MRFVWMPGVQAAFRFHLCGYRVPATAGSALDKVSYSNDSTQVELIITSQQIVCARTAQTDVWVSLSAFFLRASQV